MTKEKALSILINYVYGRGALDTKLPVKDEIVYREFNIETHEWDQWTFQGLQQLLIS